MYVTLSVLSTVRNTYKILLAPNIMELFSVREVELHVTLQLNPGEGSDETRRRAVTVARAS